MRPKRKVFIQNCTGDDCGNEKSSKQKIVVSAFWSRFIFYFLFLGFIGVTVYVLFFAYYLRINKINISGTQELSSQELQQKIQETLTGKYLNFIPRNNFLFVSQSRLETLLMGQYKKIRSVTVEKKFPDSVSVSIDERKALLVWCSSNKCYLLDENGTAYSEADFSSPELVQNHLFQITDNSGAEVVIGEKIIEQDYEQYVLAIKDEALKVNHEVLDQFWTPSRMSQEINAKTTQGFDLYFSTHLPLEAALQNLGLILKKEIPGDQKSNLVYVDLRNESKVFYKFNDSESSEDQENVQQSDAQPQATSSETDKTKEDKKK